MPFFLFVVVFAIPVNTVCECSWKHEWFVDQSYFRCSASQSAPDVESGRASEWLLVQASYIRATWWAYAALLVVIVLYWIEGKLYQSIFGIEYGQL